MSWCIFLLFQVSEEKGEALSCVSKAVQTSSLSNANNLECNLCKWVKLRCQQIFIQKMPIKIGIIFFQFTQCILRTFSLKNAWIIYSRKCSEFMSCWCVEYLFHTLLSYKTVTLCVWANPTQRKQTTFILFYSLTFRPNVGLLFFPKLNFTCKKALLWSVRHKWFAPGLLMLVSYFLMSLRTLRRKAKHSTCRNF